MPALGEWIGISALFISIAAIVITVIILARDKAGRTELQQMREDLSQCERDCRALQRQLLRVLRQNEEGGNVVPIWKMSH